MKNILEELYWGNLQTDMMLPQKSEEQLRKEAGKLLELSGKFHSLIGDAAEKAYEELSTYINETDADNEAKTFAGGFKLGALFMIEVLS